MEKWFKIVRNVYIVVLRPLVVEKVEDSASKIDDFVLGLLDNLFDVDVAQDL